MPLRVIAFLICQAAVSGYAFARGGTPERIVTIELALATVAGELMSFERGLSFRVMEGGMLLLDVALLAALIPVALYANRYWPIWIAAVQLDTIAVHGVRAVDETLRASVYFAMAGYAAYPILILLALGTLRHRDRETRAGAGEAAWTS